MEPSALHAFKGAVRSGDGVGVGVGAAERAAATLQAPGRCGAVPGAGGLRVPALRRGKGEEGAGLIEDGAEGACADAVVDEVAGDPATALPAAVGEVAPAHFSIDVRLSERAPRSSHGRSRWRKSSVLPCFLSVLPQ